MPKMFIKLRKRFVLPKRWRKSEQEKADKIHPITKEKYIEIDKRLEQLVVVHRRKNDRIKTETLEGLQNFIKAIIDNRLDDHIKTL